MADVTPPGEGPPPLGHGVDPARLQAYGIAPTVAVAQGGCYVMDTPAGPIVVSHDKGMFVLLENAVGLPAGTPIELDREGRIKGAAPAPMGGFLAKQGPLPGPTPPAPTRDQLNAAVAAACQALNGAEPAVLARLRAEMAEAVQKILKQGATQQQAAPAAVPAHPGRAGRAIELD